MWQAVLLAVLLTACGRVSFDAEPVCDSSSGANPDAPDPDLVAHYPMDDVVDGVLVDATGNGHDGSCIGQQCPISVAGIKGPALHFDGIMNLIRVPSSAVLEQLTAHTISLWALIEEPPQVDRCMFTKVFGTGIGNSWEICVSGSGRVFFSVFDQAGSKNQSLMTTVSLSTSSWRHIALRWDGTTEGIYIDGLFAGEQTLPKPFDAGSLVIGADLNAGALYGPWWGAIDDVRIYRRALSASELAALAPR